MKNTVVTWGRQDAMNVINAGGAATRNCQYNSVPWRSGIRRTCKHKLTWCAASNSAAQEVPRGHSTTTGPSPFWPTRVRVQHDSYIRANRAAVWQLMQDVTLEQHWSGVSVVLATLESIYGVEYQGLAEQLLTAFQEANLAPGPAATPPPHSNSTRATSSTSSSPEQQQQQHERQYEHLGASVLGLNTSAIAGLRQRRRARSRSSSPAGSSSSSRIGSNGSSPTDSVDGSGPPQQQQQQGGAQADDHGSSSLNSSSDGRSSAAAAAAAEAAAAAAATIEEEELEAAAAADALFTQLLLLLAMRAGFVPLCERDVQLSISLNTDFLWQLFVKANTEQLDDQFVANNVELFNSTGTTELQLPDKADKMLVLRRGYSSEKQRGRWLLQKLDYLQLLLVKRLVFGVTNVGSAVWNQIQQSRIRSRSGDLGDLDLGLTGLDLDQSLDKDLRSDHGSSASHRQQQQPGELVGHRQQQQYGDQGEDQVAAALAALAGRPQHNSSSRQGVKQRQPQVDAFGRSYGYLDDNLDASSLDRQQQYGQAVTTLVKPGNEAQEGQGHSARSHSSSSSSVGHSQQPKATAITAISTATNTVSRKRSNKAASSRLKQQRRKKQLQARKQQQQQQRMLADLRSKVSDRLKSIAHTLSGWGLIPRMDVIPLERFDEVFPLNEPSRLKPLYIEKATLPDIMDPVIEPKVNGLGRLNPGQLNSDFTSGSSGATKGLDPVAAAARPKTPLTAADGSSYSSLDSYDLGDLPTPAAAGGISAQDGSSSSSVGSQHKGSSGGLLDALLQPVEIVEPTFRQLLVVYRKKPRVDQWQRFRERFTGRNQPVKQKRRSAIQLQVYRDIPLPSWQVVFPDKLLQFRPLDLLRLDIFGVAGIGAALAQAKYTSIILQLLTLASLSVWIFRITLGYLRMGDRYKSIIAQLLAERTVAGGEGGLEYLATAAGLQQFKQAALVYVLLAGSEKALTVDEVAEAAEKLLEDQLQLQVCFNAEEALQELQRFGLLVVEQQQQQPLLVQTVARSGPAVSTEAMKPPPAAAAAARSVPVNGTRQLAASDMEMSTAQTRQHKHQGQRVYKVLGSDAAQQVLQQYWAGLLQQRVNSILRDV